MQLQRSLTKLDRVSNCGAVSDYDWNGLRIDFRLHQSLYGYFRADPRRVSHCNCKNRFCHFFILSVKRAGSCA